MKILYIDIDSLRPDHLGCYGYHRDTSPTIDRVAEKGVRFTNCYTSDAPCLPSRTALFGGRFGIHTGVINHGGMAADLPREGASRGFRTSFSEEAWMTALRNTGLHTVSISSFPERHSAWHFNIGMNETYNTGKAGNEDAHEVGDLALDWLGRNKDRDNWFLHVNFWDPHTMYTAPEEFGEPFADDPPPDWLTEETRAAHYAGYGPHSARETWSLKPPKEEQLKKYPRVPAEIGSLDDWKKWIDGYDTAIKYCDLYIGKILDELEAQGILEETAIIISADHGENQGELNIYGDHQTADQHTCRIPMIISWPGMEQGSVKNELCYNIDLAPTVTELCGGEIVETWDAVSFADAIKGRRWDGWEYLVISQGAWACQRSVRFGAVLMMETYHDGLKMVDPLMLFDLNDDPHEEHNIAEANPDIITHGKSLLHRWQTEMMSSSTLGYDPMWQVVEEGGPHHTQRGHITSYCRYLRKTDRGEHADYIESVHGAE